MSFAWASCSCNTVLSVHMWKSSYSKTRVWPSLPTPYRSHFCGYGDRLRHTCSRNFTTAATTAAFCCSWCGYIQCILNGLKSFRTGKRHIILSPVSEVRPRGSIIAMGSLQTFLPLTSLLNLIFSGPTLTQALQIRFPYLELPYCTITNDLAMDFGSSADRPEHVLYTISQSEARRVLSGGGWG